MDPKVKPVTLRWPCTGALGGWTQRMAVGNERYCPWLLCTLFQAFQWLCSHLHQYYLLPTCMIYIILSLPWSTIYSNIHNVAHNQMHYVLVTLSVVHKWYSRGWRPRDRYHLCTFTHLRVVSTSKYLLLLWQLRKISHTYKLKDGSSRLDWATTGTKKPLIVTVALKSCYIMPEYGRCER